MTAPVEIEIEGAVATVWVDNPPVNALADAVIEALGSAAAQIAASEVRAVVLTGAGERTFLAGADLNEFGRALGDAEKMAGHARLTGEVFGGWLALPIPVVAAVGGHATGGGLEMALLCDLIVVDPRARLGLPEVTLGLIPGAGGTQRLPRRVGRGLASRMLLLGILLDAEEALAAGLVDQVAEPGQALGEAQELAARLARASGPAIRAGKAALRAAATEPLDRGLERERELFLGVARGADAREGVTAFIEKRRPEFRHG
ncbi:MAG: enoyl-CoA hydratase/isomerase family protein [Solirubrobacterales bacterium]